MIAFGSFSLLTAFTFPKGIKLISAIETASPAKVVTASGSPARARLRESEILSRNPAAPFPTPSICFLIARSCALRLSLSSPGAKIVIFGGLSKTGAFFTTFGISLNNFCMSFPKSTKDFPARKPTNAVLTLANSSSSWLVRLILLKRVFARTSNCSIRVCFSAGLIVALRSRFFFSASFFAFRASAFNLSSLNVGVLVPSNTRTPFSKICNLRGAGTVRASRSRAPGSKSRICSAVNPRRAIVAAVSRCFPDRTSDKIRDC